MAEKEKQIPKKYDFSEAEPRILQIWEKNKTYKFNPKNNGKIYSVDTPPPYISGKMHIGHAFSYSQQDFIVRFMRMRGHNIFYPFGTDDNGLPTERFIEKVNKVKSKNMSRAEFIELCLKTLKTETPKCIQDFKDLAISSDYDMYYSTIDKHSQKVSQKSFIELFKDGIAYQKDFPTIWCPDCQTSIAQAELEDKEHGSFFSTLKFESEGKELPIATTRPELLPACVAIFVHPEDERYKEFVGKKAIVPITNQEVPIIEDESADPEKGTGVLMICSYGDRFDVDAINRHNLSPKVILDKDGTFSEGPYKGMKVEESRKKILEELKKEKLILEQKQISHVVNTHDKCGTAIEFIPTKQWFIKILDKKKELLKRADEIKWYPGFMKKRYENWVSGLEWDWSISRNRHFGVPIPVWECESCNEVILPEESELPVDPLQEERKCPKCGKNAIPENMVFDTWATSSLTPQIALNLPEAKEHIKLPFSLRPQGHDIIRTWAFYTIVKSHYHENKIPWEEIVISGNVSLGGEKMSKSKGNVIKPQEVMEKYGADALRFWAAGSKLGQDLDYLEQDLVAGKKTITKLWNASKFVFMNLEDYDKKSKPKKLEKLDTIFLTKLNELIKSTTKAFEEYEYSKVKQDIEHFFWKEFADNYLEIVKKRVYNETGDKKLSAQYTLYTTLKTILKIFAPIMPFITEELYQIYFKNSEEGESIHLSEWPKELKTKKEEPSFKDFTELLSKIRQEKTNAQKAMNAEIKLTLEKDTLKKLGETIKDLQDVTNATEVNKGEFRVEFIESEE